MKPIGKEKVAEIMVGRKGSEQWMEIKKWLAGAWSTKGRNSEWGNGWHGGGGPHDTLMGEE